MRIVTTIPTAYLDDLAAIEQRSNPHPWTRESLCDAYRQFENLGIFEDTRLVAFVLYRIIAGEAEIVHLVCDKNEQGCGYARHLMTTLHERLGNDHVEQLFLEVRETNQPAQQLYRGLGFQLIGRRKAYYQNREDALLMKIAL